MQQTRIEKLNKTKMIINIKKMLFPPPHVDQQNAKMLRGKKALKSVSEP